MARLRAHLDAEGRDPLAVGVDARIHIGRTEPDTWKRRADEMSALGITHLTVNTGRDGRTPDWHVERLRHFRDVLSQQ